MNLKKEVNQQYLTFLKNIFRDCSPHQFKVNKQLVYLQWSWAFIEYLIYFFFETLINLIFDTISLHLLYNCIFLFIFVVSDLISSYIQN
jgi:hypothetical protein